MIKSSNINYNKFYKKYSWILGCIILLYGLYIYLDNKTELFSSKSDAYGVVYDVTSLRVVNYSGSLYKYKFLYKGKYFFGKTTKRYSGNFEDDIFYRVKFISDNPMNNEISFKNEFIQKINLDKKGKVLDTLYVVKD